MSDGIPAALREYVEGLKAHDIARVAASVSYQLEFLSAAKLLGKTEFLDMLRALYAGFPDWRYEYDRIEDRGGGNYAIRWRQGGTHTGVLAMPGLDPIPPTGRSVRIPEQYFFYRVAGGKVVEIRPEPVAGGAPRGILEQIGVELPPL